jgi:hypothetical protein
MPQIACPSCAATLVIPGQAVASLRCTRCQKNFRLNRRNRPVTLKPATSTAKPASSDAPLSETGQTAKSKRALLISLGGCFVLALLGTAAAAAFIGLKHIGQSHSAHEENAPIHPPIGPTKNSKVAEKPPQETAEKKSIAIPLQVEKKGDAKISPPKETPIPSFSPKELQETWVKSPADFFEKYGNKRIEVEGVFNATVRDDGVTDYDYFNLATDKGAMTVMVSFDNPFVPGSLKPKQTVRFSGIVVTQYTNGVLAGYALTHCKLVTPKADKPHPSPGR